MDDLAAGAKEMYIDHNCNHYFMLLNGTMDEYRQFGATSEQEAEWRMEFIEHGTSRLSVDELYAVDRLAQPGADEALQALMRMADRGDSYAEPSIATFPQSLRSRLS